MKKALARGKLHSIVFALDVEITRESLRGLQGVQVVVEDLDPEIERDGLTRKALQRDTARKLRRVGIKVLSTKQFLTTPGRPLMLVVASILKRKYTPSYVFSIRVELVQNASLVRAPDIATPAVTWSITQTGITPKLEDIRTLTKNLMDQFIKAYLSVNPK